MGRKSFMATGGKVQGMAIALSKQTAELKLATEALAKMVDTHTEALLKLGLAKRMLNANRWPHTPSCNVGNEDKSEGMFLCTCRTAGHNELIDRVLDYLEGIK